jgi:hypothetical protein
VRLVRTRIRRVNNGAGRRRSALEMIRALQKASGTTLIWSVFIRHQNIKLNLNVKA